MKKYILKDGDFRIVNAIQWTGKNEIDIDDFLFENHTPDHYVKNGYLYNKCGQRIYDLIPNCYILFSDGELSVLTEYVFNSRYKEIKPYVISEDKCTKHKLTNLDISEKYSKSKFWVSLKDFKSSFIYCATRQDDNVYIPSGVYNAANAYIIFLAKRYFKKHDDIVEMHYETIKKLTDEDLFIAIPDIYRLNETEPIIDLGALSRNVFFEILRRNILEA